MKEEIKSQNYNFHFLKPMKREEEEGTRLLFFHVTMAKILSPTECHTLQNQDYGQRDNIEVSTASQRKN